MKQISIANSAENGISVILLGKDRKLLQEIEARTENDPDLQRINVYSVDKVADFSRLAREYSVNLAIIENGTEGKDFVFLQMEVKQASPGCAIIPLVITPSIGLVRTAQKNGGLIEIGDPSDMKDYQKIKNYILSFARTLVSEGLSLNEIKPLRTIQKALVIGHPDWQEKKEISSECVNQILPFFDLSVNECKLVISAEKIFVPWLNFEAYSKLLGGDYSAILKTLGESASWTGSPLAPKSINGLIITSANFIAEQLVQECADQVIIETFEARPIYLKHPGIRTFTAERLATIFNAITERRSLSQTG